MSLMATMMAPLATITPLAWGVAVWVRRRADTRRSMQLPVTAHLTCNLPRMVAVWALSWQGVSPLSACGAREFCRRRPESGLNLTI